MHDKKGLSTVVITLILILLSIVAIGIVWVVVANVLKSGGEQTSSALGGLFLNLKIEHVKVETNGDVKVTVKRNAGEGEITGINFIVSDGENSQVIKKDEPISELAMKTFTITSAELTDVVFVKTVEIAPVSGTEGKEQIGNVVDKFEKNNIGLNDLKDYRIVSWWRMEGDAKDKIGSNDGTLQGATFVDGKFGKTGSFDGSGDWIEVNDDNSLDISNEITISAWTKIGTSGDIQVIVEKRTSGIADTNYALDIRLVGTPYFAFYNGGWKTIETSTIITDNNWHYVVATYDKQNMKIYIDGTNKNTIAQTAPLLSNNGPLLFGHILGYPSAPYWVNGQIDEVMIFNKALTEEQVKALYEMDLS